ncbi:MAG TPA: hypothetical protein ENJ82_16215 [Bacteroidetes bacterium]|nr:hypothetical protein [Bacteroidota bacterium]
MICLPDFQKAVLKSTQHAHAIQEVFLHSLFPSSIPYKSAWKNALSGTNTYQQVAMLGYYLWIKEEVQKDFGIRMDWLMGIQLEKSKLPLHKEALLGLAIGLKLAGNEKQKEWFRNQLLPLLLPEDVQAGLSAMLLQILQGKVGEIPPGAKAEYCFFPGLFLGLSPSEIDSEALKSYFLKARKFPFPAFKESGVAKEDFFRSMLAVFILDKCLEQSVWEPERIKILKSEALDPVRRVLHRRATCYASILISVLLILLLSGLAFCFWQLGQYISVSNSRQDKWQLFKFSFYFLGGPVSTLLYLLRLFYFIFTKKKASWDIEILYAQLRLRMEKKLYARYNIS